MKAAFILVLMFCGSGCSDGALSFLPTPVSAEFNRNPVETVAPDLSPTRKLRRISLTLRGKEPSRAEYKALLAVGVGGAPAALSRAVDDALGSNDFYAQMLAWGHDYLRNAVYAPGSPGGTGGWPGGPAAEIQTCATGTTHAGAYVFVTDNLCNTATVPVAMVEPWWAPGTSVRATNKSMPMRSR